MRSIVYKLIMISAIVALCAGAAMAQENNTTDTEAAPEEVVEETVVDETVAEETVAEETLAENLTISAVNATLDSVEITNNGVDLSLLNYTLAVDNNETVVLPDYALGAGNIVTVFLGAGNDTDTELFMNSAVVLNDMGGNVTLKDPEGIELSMFEF